MCRPWLVVVWWVFLKVGVVVSYCRLKLSFELLGVSVSWIFSKGFIIEIWYGLMIVLYRRC